MKIPCVVIGLTKSDEVRVYLSTMNKADALSDAKARAADPDADVRELRVIAGIGSAIQWRKPIRGAVESTPEALAPSSESADAKALRAKLKAKGVSVPPRINADTLLALAVEHGVE